MNHGNERSSPDRVRQTILNTLLEVFAEPDFDSDSGVVRLLDHDEECVWLGLFATNDDGEIITSTPTEVFTIEVSRSEGESK